MRRANQVTTLRPLGKAGFDLKLEKPHSGKLKLGSLQCHIEVAPDEVLCVRVGENVDLSALEKVQSVHRFLLSQHLFPTPVKFTLSADLQELQLVGELPLKGEETLPTACHLLSQGVFAICSQNSNGEMDRLRASGYVEKLRHEQDLKKGSRRTSRKSALPKIDSIPELSLPIADVAKQLAAACKNSGDEMADQANGWRVSVNSARYFQRINFSLEENLGLIRCHAPLVTVSAEEQIVQIALSLFLLEAVARLRFVRGVMFEDQTRSEMLVGLEVVVPLCYARVLTPSVALECTKAGTGFTKLACEAMLQRDTAETYLSRRYRIDLGRLQKTLAQSQQNHLKS